MSDLEFTVEDHERAIALAIEERDFEAAAGLMERMAVRWPDRAEAVMDTIRLGLTIAREQHR